MLATRSKNIETQPHLARWRDRCKQGRPSSARVAGVSVGRLVAGASRACCLQSPALVVVWEDAEIAVEGRVKPDVVPGEPVEG